MAINDLLSKELQVKPLKPGETRTFRRTLVGKIDPQTKEPYVLSDSVKRRKEDRNKTILTTFGMLNRNKGLEYVIEGLPRVLEKHQDFVYIIVGATHPNTLEIEGETYRNSLIKRVNELGVCHHVLQVGYNCAVPDSIGNDCW